MTMQLYQPPAPHQPPHQLLLAEVLAPLTHALDLTEGQPAGHSARCAWIGTQIGEALGLMPAALDDLYYTLLLKDLGCSSNAAAICEIYQTDDIDFKSDFKIIDGSLNDTLRFVFARTARDAGLADRFRAVVNILRNGVEISRNLIETRCHRGADIAAKLRLSTGVQDNIRALDERWDGSGKPLGLKGADIPTGANIALLSQVIDVFHHTHGCGAAIREVRKRSGTWFDPALVDAFCSIATPGFWLGLRNPQVEDLIFDMAPARRSLVIDAGYLDDVANAFSDVVDAKSSFTADHSGRVTLYCDMIGEELGLTEDHRRWLRRGALLHDLGKLGVSNAVLDKPGKLDDDEWQVIRNHPVHGFDILQRVKAFQDIAAIARHHHERLDGRGYPDGLTAADLPIEVRIASVADVFDALSAARPYRDAMPVDDVFAILDKDTGSAFDGECVNALRSAMTRIRRHAA